VFGRNCHIIEDLGALKIKSPDHIVGVESNSSNMIGGVISIGSEMCGVNSFNSSENIGDVSSNLSNVLGELL
jgi:hypothetical protein